MKAASKTNRDRQLADKVLEVDRARRGAATAKPVPYVPCSATVRRNPRAATLTGCREKLAGILVEPGSTIAFEVLAPVEMDGDIVVLQQPAKRGRAPAIVRPLGASVTFRCARCGGDTRVVLALLRAALGL